MFKALACAAALTVCASGAASAAPVAPVTYNIAFTGFCDGMTLNVYHSIYTTGVSTGCNAGALDQGLQTVVRRFNGLVVSGNQNFAPSLFTYALDLNQLTFKVYTSNGTSVRLLNQGTFTLSQVPAGNASLKSSNGR